MGIDRFRKCRYWSWLIFGLQLDIVAGIGVPQLTRCNFFRCLFVCSKYNVPLILKEEKYTEIDGGIRYSGDVVKGSCQVGVPQQSCVMLGSVRYSDVVKVLKDLYLAGETIIFEGRKFKTYRGMELIEACKRFKR